ncbi:putative quinol monooxygenase [Pseudonocardia zijingensis]|jgi:quinol monooxygenase YgiN|uniref:Antibiotic biosynthesis monooxygenase n=1 Tax=Pseudonocardia zijingensis TaxID=153376 RepID=A0ABP3ZUH2_9PSEU
MPKPVVVTAVFRPADGRHAEARAAIEDVLPVVHAEDGCLLYALHEAADGTLVLIEKWESEGLLGAHAAGQGVKQLTTAIEGLLAAPPTVVTMAPLPGGDPAKGRL